LDKLIVLDTTLRDGAQTPGIGINVAEKIRIALQLERLGVDFMEVGFPAASIAEFEAVSEIAKRVQNSGVVALARSSEKDIDRACEAIEHAAKPRLQTFVSSSDIHMKHKLRMSRNEVLDVAIRSVEYACGKIDEVQFGFEDGSRTDPEFLCELCEAVINAGACCVNIADTVGFSLPGEFAELVKYVIDNTPNIGDAVVGVHCHDDLGLGTANTLAAVAAGARQVDVTINGIGERAGNTPLEEIAATLHTKSDSLGLTTGIVLDQIYPTSRLVSTLTGVPVQPNKAVIGSNAFSHESGIHQDGMLKSPLTYQIMTPEAFGAGETKLVLGKQSGRHGLASRLESLGWKVDDDVLGQVYKEFMQVADRKRSTSDEDLDAIVTSCLFKADERFKMESLSVNKNSAGVASVTLALCRDGVSGVVTNEGDSLVESVFGAIEELAGTGVEVLGFSVSALTDGTDAQVEAIVRLKDGDKSILGRAIDSDIVLACAKAHVDGLNRFDYITRNPVLRTGQKWDRRRVPREAGS